VPGRSFPVHDFFPRTQARCAEILWYRNFPGRYLMRLSIRPGSTGR
jgi:hypothetical protein